jgi:allophanate hydrolase
VIPDLLEIAAVHAAYAAGTLTPVSLVSELLRRIEEYSDKAVFISRVPAADVFARAETLQAGGALFGIPFVVKDNIDVAGMETTAACPEFAYVAERHAPVVERLLAAGGILLGKANLDQFATGLNGTRSPYGAPRSVFNSDFCSGGSSSGSAVAVGAGLCVFSLGTDTAGSGRVPAMFNGIVGLKPTIGRLPTTGVVPACKSIDCVSVFANCPADAVAVLRVAEGVDAGDAYSRAPVDVRLPRAPKVGVLAAQDREFFGDAARAALYADAVTAAEGLGWEVRKIDYKPFRAIAESLYGGAFVAERLAATRTFFAAHADKMDPVVRGIVAGAAAFSGADVFDDVYRVKGLRGVAEAAFADVDILLLPTAPTMFSVEAMRAEPVLLNSRLGIYTNFTNLMDLAAVAVPAGFTDAGMPFGVTVIGPAFSDISLAGLGDALHVALRTGSGVKRIPAASRVTTLPYEATVIVAGAHLSGMVLNHELTALGAELVGAAKTAADYKLFALGTVPPKPGLVRMPGFAGDGIEVEVWGMTIAAFGAFVKALPAPMGIGKVVLADGSEHPGFLCEVWAVEGAEDITGFGGWRKFRAARG